MHLIFKIMIFLSIPLLLLACFDEQSSLSLSDSPQEPPVVVKKITTNSVNISKYKESRFSSPQIAYNNVGNGLAVWWSDAKFQVLYSYYDKEANSWSDVRQTYMGGDVRKLELLVSNDDFLLKPQFSPLFINIFNSEKKEWEFVDISLSKIPKKNIQSFYEPTNTSLRLSYFFNPNSISTDGDEIYLTALFYKATSNVEVIAIKLLILRKSDNSWNVERVETLTPLSTFQLMGHTSSVFKQRLVYTWVELIENITVIYSQNYDIEKNIFSKIEIISKTSDYNLLDINTVANEKGYAVHYSLNESDSSSFYYLQKIKICTYDKKFNCVWSDMLNELLPRDTIYLYSYEDDFIVFKSNFKRATFNYISNQDNEWVQSKDYFSEIGADIISINTEGNNFYIRLACRWPDYNGDSCSSDSLTTLEINNNVMTEVKVENIPDIFWSNMFVHDGEIDVISTLNDEGEYPQYNIAVTSDNDVAQTVHLMKEPYASPYSNYNSSYFAEYFKPLKSYNDYPDIPGAFRVIGNVNLDDGALYFYTSCEDEGCSIYSIKEINNVLLNKQLIEKVPLGVTNISMLMQGEYILFYSKISSFNNIGFLLEYNYFSEKITIPITDLGFVFGFKIDYVRTEETSMILMRKYNLKTRYYNHNDAEWSEEEIHESNWSDGYLIVNDEAIHIIGVNNDKIAKKIFNEKSKKWISKTFEMKNNSFVYGVKLYKIDGQIIIQWESYFKEISDYILNFVLLSKTKGFGGKIINHFVFDDAIGEYSSNFLYINDDFIVEIVWSVFEKVDGWAGETRVTRAASFSLVDEESVPRLK